MSLSSSGHAALFVAHLLVTFMEFTLACPSGCSCNNTYQMQFYRYRSISETNCSNADLKQVPSGITLSVRKLDLSYNNIIYIGETDFYDMDTLMELHLQHNQIKEIDPAAFSSSQNLQILNLSDNKLTTLHGRTFYYNIELSTLDLSYNNLKVLQTDHFRRLINLRNLYMRGCNMSEISFSTFNQALHLSIIDISFNHFEELNITSQSSSLSTIRITNNSQTIKILDYRLSIRLNQLDLTGTSLNLTQIKPRSSRSSIYTLVLNDCNLTESPVPFIQSSTPIALYLNNNMLREFNRNTGTPSTFRLFLSRNQITKIEPDAISHMKYLWVLNISYNPFDLPEDGTFLNNDNLEILTMTSCAISRLTSKTFQNLPLLKIIDLSNNSIGVISHDVFQNMPNVIELSLHGNKISVIEKEAFLHNVRLVTLDLSRNPLLLPGDELISAPSLIHLKISSCNLTSLPLNTFSHNRLMKTLDVSFNKLEYINAKVFSYNNKLNELNMSQNPFVCDYKLRPLWLYCFDNSVKCVANCSNPEGSWNLLESVTIPILEETTTLSVTTKSSPAQPQQPTTTTTATAAAPITATTAGVATHPQASFMRAGGNGVATTVLVLLLIGLTVGVVIGSLSGCLWLQKYILFGRKETNGSYTRANFSSSVSSLEQLSLED